MIYVKVSLCGFYFKFYVKGEFILFLCSCCSLTNEPISAEGTVTKEQVIQGSGRPGKFKIRMKNTQTGR